MQTTLLIYVVIWVLIVVPLVGFNVKRTYVKRYPDKPKIRWGYCAFLAGLSLLLSLFLFGAYQVTISSRYELAAERCIDIHAEYLAGKIDYDEYMDRARACRTPEADTTDFDNELSSENGIATSGIRFQISSWIIPKYYQDDDAFPKTDVIDANNPVYVLYLMDDHSKQTYYTLRMIKESDGWKIDYQAPATEAQIKAAKSALPSQVNGQWFTVG